MKSAIKEQIAEHLPSGVIRIWLHPYRVAAILLLIWAATYSFLAAIHVTGDRTYLWGAAAFGSLAVVAHVVVHKALGRVQKRIDELEHAAYLKLEQAVQNSEVRTA